MEGIQTSTYLALNEHKKEILNIAERKEFDLIAMTSNGHHFLADFFLGITIEGVRHGSVYFK